MRISDAWANKHLNLLLGAAPARPATIKVCLGRGATDVNGTGFVEANGTGYAAVDVPNDATGWSGAAGRATSNVAEVSHGTVGTGGWGGTCTQYALKAPDGSIMFVGTLDGSGFVDTVGVRAYIPAGGMVIESPAA